MTIQEAFNVLVTHPYFDAEIKLIDDVIHWHHDIGYFDPEEDEAHDVLWDDHCNASEMVKKLLSEDEFEIVETGADNDSCWFDIKKK